MTMSPRLLKTKWPSLTIGLEVEEPPFN